MANYQNAVRSIAAEALNGEDVEARVTALAKYLRMDRSSVTHDINEMVDIIKD